MMRKLTNTEIESHAVSAIEDRPFRYDLKPMISKDDKGISFDGTTEVLCGSIEKNINQFGIVAIQVKGT